MNFNFRDLKLRNKLLLAIIPITVISIFIILAIFSRSASNNIIALQNSLMNQVVDQSMDALDSWLEERTNFIEVLAENETFVAACQGEKLDEAQDLLKYLLKKLPMYENIFLADPEGQIFLIAMGNAGELNLSEIELFKISVTKNHQGETWIGDAGKSPVTGRPVSLITSPIYDNNRNMIGIMGTPVELTVFSEKFISKTTVGKTGYLYMLNSEGVPLAHPEAKNIMNDNFKDFEFVKEILSKNNGDIRYQFEGRPKIAYFHQHPERKWIIVATDFEDEYLAPIRQMNMLSGGLAIIAIAVISIITWLISNFVSKMTMQLVETVKEIAMGRGDLTQRFNIQRNDEIGQLANWFNKFIEKLHEIISQVKMNTEEVASATNEINATSMQMAAGAEEQSSQVNEVATAIQEMSAAIVQSSQNASQTAEISKRTVSKADEGLKNMGLTQQSMENIVVSSAKTNDLVSSLSNRTDQIGEIIQVIDDIADQTNLLALNAAIEAARAGEQGRGFAVVADEVRKLAERTTKATKEIGNTIKVIQDDTQSAAESMHEVTSVIDEGKTAIVQTAEVLKEIVQGVNNAMDMIQQIASATEQQSAGAEEISKNVHSISSVASESASGAEQLAVTTGALSRQTENLQELVSQFKL